MFFFHNIDEKPAIGCNMEDVQYQLSYDANRKRLDGGKNYKLHLSPNIPACNFWSIVVYDNQTHLMIRTDQPWPSVHSQCVNLLINQDGSVDAFFGPKAPPGKENNWVKTIPGKGWSLVLRLYGPPEPWFINTWKPGGIELQQ